jgi:hypothetical protein
MDNAPFQRSRSMITGTYTSLLRGVASVTFRCFNYEGTIQPSGRWVLLNRYNNRLQYLPPQTDLLEVMLTRLGLVRAKRRRRAAMFVVNPRWGVMLSLGNHLTSDKWSQKRVGDGYITIPGFVLRNTTYTVRIAQKPAYNVAPADGRGNVLL